jgi:hypothetical protein
MSEVEIPVEPVEPVTNVTEPVVETTETPPAEPKKRGRPTGAKDTTKRTRKPVQIRVEPLQEKPEPPVPKPEPIEPRKPAEPPAEIEEPKTPRTLIKETSRHLISLRALVNDNRKDEMGKRYIQKWSKCPLN